MRYFVGFVLVLFPLGVGAQDVEEAATAEPGVQEPAPSFEPPSEQPALQLQLDDAGVEVAPSPPRTPDGYTLEEMELRVKRPKIGIGVSAGALAAGMAMGLAVLGASMCPFSFDPARPPCPPSWVDPVGNAGLALGVGGLAGIIASGILLRRRKRDRDWLRQAHYTTPRRVQWDLAQSRLVF